MRGQIQDRHHLRRLRPFTARTTITDRRHDHDRRRDHGRHHGADRDRRDHRDAVATRLARFARRAGVFQLLAGFLIDDAHRQANLAARIDLEDLDLDFLAFGHDVGRLFNALVPDFRDVDETVLAAHEVHERAEIDDVDDLAVVDLADFGFLDDAEDPLAGGFDLRRGRTS